MIKTSNSSLFNYFKLALLLLFILGNGIYFSKTYYHQTDIIISATIQNGETFQLFYDSGDGFNENESIIKHLKPKPEKQDLHFSLPGKKIFQLRIDPTNRKENFDLHSITVKTLNSTSVYAGATLMPYIIHKNDISDITPSTDGVNVTVNGNDPYIIFSKFLNLQDELSIKYKLLYSFLAAILLFFIYFLSTLQRIHTAFFFLTENFSRSFDTQTYLAYTTPLLLLLVFIIPNLQTPDAEAHFLKAYSLSEGHMAIHTENARNSGGYVDANVLEYIRNTVMMRSDRNAKHNQKILNNVETLHFSNKRVYAEFPGSSYYIPLIYLPQTFTIKIGKLIDATIHNTYTTARIVNVLMTLAIIVYALKFLSFGREFVWAVLLLPMTLSQISGIGIDGIIYALSLLFLSLFTYALDQKNPWKLGHIMLSWFVLSLLIATRPSFFVFGFLLLAIAIYRKSYKDFFIMGVFAIGVLLWTLYALNHVVDHRIPREITTSEQLQLFVESPSIFFSVLKNTISDPNILISYFKMFVGVLGWLDTPLPAISYYVAIPFLFLALIASSSSNYSAPFFSTMLLCLILIASFIIIIFLLWISWTPLSSSVVIGVQGRYFIPLAFGLGIVLSGTLNYRQSIHKFYYLTLRLWIVALYVTLPFFLWGRYW